MDYRIGIGFDIHRLVEGRPLVIGGTGIPYVKGLLGHSDADVLLHAVCDAILGAASLGDIGELFPDTDPAFLGIASTVLLEETMKLVRNKGYRVNNLDTVVIAQEPSLAPFKKGIRTRIAALLAVSVDAVSIKAKTHDSLDSIGRKEAIAAYAAVTLVREV